MPNALIGQRFNLDDRVIRKFTTGFPNKFKIKKENFTRQIQDYIERVQMTFYRPIRLCNSIV